MGLGKLCFNALFKGWRHVTTDFFMFLGSIPLSFRKVEYSFKQLASFPSVANKTCLKSSIWITPNNNISNYYPLRSGLGIFKPILFSEEAKYTFFIPNDFAETKAGSIPSAFTTSPSRDNAPIKVVLSGIFALIEFNSFNAATANGQIKTTQCSNYMFPRFLYRCVLHAQIIIDTVPGDIFTSTCTR